MEHHPDTEPMRVGRRFRFDVFDKLCAEALEEDAAMAAEGQQLEAEQTWVAYDRVLEPPETA